MSDLLREISLAVDVAADAVPGVERLYSAVPIGIQTARQIVSHEPSGLSAISLSNGAFVVTVSVGISAGQDTADTARRTAEAVRGAIVATTRDPAQAESARVHVRVSRVALD